MKKIIVILMALAMVLAVSGLASAATETANLNVSATVVPVCTVTTTAVNFGEVSFTGFSYANGDVAVTCPNAYSYSIALDAGNYYGPGYRTMSNGVDPPAFVLYALFQDPSYTTEWGDLGFGNTYPSGSSLADTGTGIAQPHTVYGWLELGLQGQPLGAYTDTVLVTVNY